MILNMTAYLLVSSHINETKLVYTTSIEFAFAIFGCKLCKPWIDFSLSSFLAFMGGFIYSLNVKSSTSTT